MNDSSPTASPADPPPLAAWAIAVLVMLQFASASWLWLMISDSWIINRTDYKAVWLASGYRHLPIEDVRAALDARLSRDTPIKLGPGLEANGQWAQRVKEGLYPRRITPDATLILDVAKAGDTAAFVSSPRGYFSLAGTLPPPPKGPPPARLDFGLSWGRVAWHAFAAFGWGAALALALRRKRLEVPFVAGAALAAPVVFGVLGTAATLLQKPLPWGALSVVGAILAALAIAFEVRRAVRTGTLRSRFGWLRRPEWWGIAVLTAIMIRHASIWPIIGWDGRSIWLYRAKQVAYNGYLTIADAINPLNFFSHMEYPLLFPTWQAHFATATAFREKEAAIGAMLLEVGLFAYLWWISRRRLGRWVGAAFMGAVWVVTMAGAERGYADCFVTLFLLSAMFSLEHEDTEPFGWLAVVGASLTKSEGLFFSGFAAGLYLLLHPRFRARPLLSRFAPAALLLIGALPPLWARLIGIRNQYADAQAPLSFSVALDRLGIIYSGVAKLIRESTPLAHLAGGLAVYLLLEKFGRRSPQARVMVGTATGVVVFSVLVLMVTPYDLHLQVSTAMERLLLHAVQALLAAILVVLTTTRAPERG
jgi:hypothetical protein